jgi:hypothetical protein
MQYRRYNLSYYSLKYKMEAEYIRKRKVTPYNRAVDLMHTFTTVFKMN